MSFQAQKIPYRPNVRQVHVIRFQEDDEEVILSTEPTDYFNYYCNFVQWRVCSKPARNASD